MLGALKSLLPDQDVEYQDRLIADVWRSPRNHTMGFVSRFEALLRELGREDLSRPPYRAHKLLEGFLFSFPPEFDAGSEALLTKVVPSAFLEDDVGPPPRTGLKYVAAFFELAGIKRVDQRVMYTSGCQMTRGLMRFTPSFAGPRTFTSYLRRGSPRRQGRPSLSSNRCGERGRRVPLGTFCRLSMSRMSTGAALGEFDIDMRLVEGLVHHPSEWVQQMAALFVNERRHGAARRSACEHMLATGTGDALYWASGVDGRTPRRLRTAHA